MSKQLQVLLDEAEWREIRQVARRHRMTVAEWVRQPLRVACRGEASGPADRKLRVVREAALHAYPTGPIEQMLDEIGRGYLESHG
ncbi:MAG: antitoxin [Anaerolineales bacterium]